MTHHCDCNCLSPFRWFEHARLSIFSKETAFTGTSTGKTQRQISSESADAYKDRTGRSLGTIVGISPASDLHAEESNHRRARGAR